MMQSKLDKTSKLTCNPNVLTNAVSMLSKDDNEKHILLFVLQE